MNNETYLYAVNALGGTDDGGIFRASDFLAMEIASSSTVSLKFKAGVNTAKAGKVTLTLSLPSTAGDLTFRNACEVVSGLLNNGKGNMITLADEVSGVYTLPFSGAVLVDDSL
jgi:hypothetical protein